MITRDDMLKVKEDFKSLEDAQIKILNLKEENSRILMELITVRADNEQLKTKLRNHEDRIKENTRVLQL